LLLNNFIFLIGIIPPRGYRLRDTQSASAIKWLVGEEIKNGITIQSAARGREKKIAGVGVDGYYKDATGVEHVYQVNSNLLKKKIIFIKITYIDI
jgi:hypothetical protein